MKEKPYEYGKDSNPSTWHEAATALNSRKQPAKKSKGLGVMERLGNIEALIKERK